MDDSSEPVYLVGAMAPVPDETEAIDLTVIGSLPPELEGRYFRNGSNPPPGVDPGHAFTGQGMVHGVRLAGGRALWYRNRWVRDVDASAPPADDPRHRLMHNVSNTNVIHHGGRILSLVEVGFPYELDKDLRTRGVHDYAGRLTTAMTAHPKEDAATGELHFFGVSGRPPYLTYHRADASGKLVRSVPITVPGHTLMHDFAITENYIVWLDLPVVFDAALTLRPGMPFRWSDDYGARIGVMPREGSDADVIWVPVTEGYAYHVANAYEDSTGGVVIDAIHYDRDGFRANWHRLGGPDPVIPARPTGVVHRWTIDVTEARVSEQTLDDVGIEYPSVDDSRVGRRHRYLYATTPVVVTDQKAIVYKYNVDTGDRTVWTFDTGWYGGESTFVPAAAGTREDDGWLVSIASHATADEARLLVIDASDVAAGPVAQVVLPRRVPVGFHGCWISR